MTKIKLLFKSCTSIFVLFGSISYATEVNTANAPPDPSVPSLPSIKPTLLAAASNNSAVNAAAANDELVKAATKEDAVRFLMRTTFGPKAEEVDALMATTYETWLEEQFNESPSYQTRPVSRLIDNTNTPASDPGVRQRLRTDVWFNTAIRGDDQLRQRVAFALSQILVVSERDTSIRFRTTGLTSYHDVLIRNAFGNFRELLEEVTLHPAMGDYLDMRSNRKASDDGNVQPDENYAREIMQLFTIGLNELNKNGTNKLRNGKVIPTYSMDEVIAFARVFTGWSYPGVTISRKRPFATFARAKTNDPNADTKPMVPYESMHDQGEKKLFNGTVLPAGQTAREDLEMALDNLFQHSNVGPFISKQLIQRLVTSNPSPAYVARVTSVFNNNGSGVRGDLKATIKAILLDREALLGYKRANFGKLKEPVLKLTHIWRAFDGRGTDNRFRYDQGPDELGQEILSAPSVFNFYSPFFSKPGALEDRGLVSPEFELYDEGKTISIQNRLISYVTDMVNANPNVNKIALRFNDERPLASDPAALVDHFNEFLFAGQMSRKTRDIIINYITQIPLNDNGTTRVQEGLLFAVLSPDFAYQR
ncbi:DUF1800 domain-containing protein [Agarilytica rhodophyticola]|uniref:DUF1800 domain-containing protein n=1 Tax=Agarilytica rhodophyticola TaxID=1737490 RepID=UPI000B342721|nr:DUF1800 domain-containing protein [Agarilytica rhodophyticola]